MFKYLTTKQKYIHNTRKRIDHTYLCQFMSYVLNLKKEYSCIHWPTHLALGIPLSLSTQPQSLQISRLFVVR